MATTRNPKRGNLLRPSGVDQVFIDTGSIAGQVGEVCASGADNVLQWHCHGTIPESW